MFTKSSPLIFGEVLFDVFENEKYILGGAPFNVAWHLHGFGLSPFFISSVGNDELGDKILRKMNNWGMYLQNVQRDKKHPTGKVSVQFVNNEPMYNILENQAYDYIEFEPLKTHLLIKPYPILYHGTLALRNETSRNTLSKIKQNTTCKIFMDVNLWDPWWNQDALINSLYDATWVKCNEDEFRVIVEVSQIDSKVFNEQAFQICEKYSLEFLIVTQGDKGAYLANNNKRLFHVSPKPLLNIKDTVGAGDGFSAIAILAILNNWGYQTLLERAAQFASGLCQIQGATLDDKNYYTKLFSDWKKQNEKSE
jgi:fructokinase